MFHQKEEKGMGSRDLDLKTDMKRIARIKGKEASQDDTSNIHQTHVATVPDYSKSESPDAMKLSRRDLYNRQGAYH